MGCWEIDVDIIKISDDHNSLLGEKLSCLQSSVTPGEYCSELASFESHITHNAIVEVSLPRH